MEDDYSDDLEFEEKATRPEVCNLEFTGSAGEYFRIWIVNVVLTIVTLGIYGAWAKVRTRRYFYANTLLDGEPFDYLANPIAILKGNLIILGSFLAYVILQAYEPMFSGIIILAFFLLMPFLIYKSLKFRAHNTAFRNIRFRFLGTAGESYWVFMGIPLLIPFTLGLIFPYWIFLQKEYLFDNYAFGTKGFRFGASAGYFYKTYLFAALIVMGVGAVVAVAFGAFAVSMEGVIDPVTFDPGPAVASLLVLSMLGLYIGFLVMAAFIQQYVYARITNHCWNETRVGPVAFRSQLRTWPLLWIHVTNILAMVVSMGLLIPWAKVRKTRYLIDHITVGSTDSLDYFASASEPEESAIGDAAADFFDFEFGL